MHKGKIISKVESYKTIDCKSCGFIHLYPIPDKKVLTNIYSSNYYEQEKPWYFKHNLEDKKWWKTVYKDRLETLEKFVKSKKKRLLELGSGPGLFLHYANSRNWDVTGIEPSTKASTFSKKDGLKIIKSFYENIDPDKLDKFDAVVMYEFLEHVPEPGKVLQFAYKVLRKGGIISIGVPNDYNPLQDVAVSTLCLNQYWIAPPYHINYFSLRTIEKLLKKYNFKVVQKETNFPMELFLLMGENYVGNDKLGRQVHKKRKLLDIALSTFNNKLKIDIYKIFAKYNIGRDITIYAIKA